MPILSPMFFQLEKQTLHQEHIQLLIQLFPTIFQTNTLVIVIIGICDLLVNLKLIDYCSICDTSMYFNCFMKQYYGVLILHTGSQVERGSREAKYHRESIHESKCDHSINRLQFIEPFSDIHQILLSRRIWYQEQYKYCCYDGPQDHKHCYFHLFCNCDHGNEEWCMQGGLCRRGEG